MNKKTIDNINLNNKKVLVRVDFNVPIIDGIITSTKRIDASLKTIKKLINSNAKIILFSHLGRIKSEEDKLKNSLRVVSLYLSKVLNKEVKFINKTRGRELESQIESLNNGEIILVENTRYEDFKDGIQTNYESKNNIELAKYWASLGDIFINDAFGTSHRAHASNVGISTYIKESGIGYLIEKELKMLSKALHDHKSPFIAIIGGAKISDKILIIEHMLKICDKVIVSGGMAYTFLYALGINIGDSLLEKDKVELARELLKNNKDKLILPLNFAITKEFANSPRKETDDRIIQDGYMGMDIGQKTIDYFKTVIDGAKTVIWNGPMGVFEFSNYKLGTESIAKIIVEQKDVYSIIGGGDSASAAINLGFETKFSHISTGGGASLIYMEGKPLVAIEAIQDK